LSFIVSLCSATIHVANFSGIGLTEILQAVGFLREDAILISHWLMRYVDLTAPPTRNLLTVLLVSYAGCAGDADEAPTLVEHVSSYTLAGNQLKTFDAIVFEQGKVFATGGRTNCASISMRHNTPTARVTACFPGCDAFATTPMCIPSSARYAVVGGIR
jgi:hypothetical protein